MMLQRHTPGPWVLHRPGSMRACDGRHDSADGCRTIVEAEIVGVPRPEAEANARLISAAPDLLDAAHAAYHALKSYQHGNAAPDLAEECAAALMIAILKAVGPS